MYVMSLYGLPIAQLVPVRGNFVTSWVTVGFSRRPLLCTDV